MADKSLVMTFLNQDGSRASITIPGVKDAVTEVEVSAAMDTVIAKNVFYSSGGDLVSKHSAQITERNVTDLDVK
jgi:Protein of unknown function (DUF2922).